MDSGKEISKQSTPEDVELEREIRSRRKFSVAEAIGREGADLLKGASPVTLKRQAELQIKDTLRRNIEDEEGALKVVLARRVRDSEVLLATHYSESLGALVRVTEHILASDSRLRHFVRAIDAEWGRIYSERPYFEQAGKPAQREDPYTVSSVRGTLTELLERLRPEIED